MTQYVAQLKAGKSHIEAFEATFDITATDLDLEVRRYFKKALVPNYRLNIDKVVPDFAPKVTVLTSERTSLVFAQAALLNGQLDTAEQWFTIAATFEDVRPQAESGLGSVLVEREDFDAAQAHFEKAVALAPDDPYVQLDIAKYWSARAKNSVGTVDQFANVARAREHFINAWKIDASMPEVYALYGETFLLGDKDYDRAIEMLQHAERLLPSSISVRLSLAESYFGASRFAEAESSARLVLRWSQSETDAVERAQAVLDRLPTNR
jgi:tetratricopeptide (TPR) repeat protein